MTTVAFIINKDSITIGCDSQLTTETANGTKYSRVETKFIRTGHGYIGLAGSAYGSAVIFYYLSKGGAELKSDLVYNNKDIFAQLPLDTDIKEVEETAKYDFALICSMIKGIYKETPNLYMGNDFFYVDQKRVIIGVIEKDFTYKITYIATHSPDIMEYHAIGSGYLYAKRTIDYLDDHLSLDIKYPEIMRRALQCSNSHDLGTGSHLLIERAYFRDIACVRENAKFNDLGIAIKKIKDRKSINKLTFSFIRLHRMIAYCFGSEFEQKWAKIFNNLIFETPNLISINTFLTTYMLFYKYKRRDHYGGKND